METLIFMEGMSHENQFFWLADQARNLENNLSQVQHSEDSTVPAEVPLLAIWTSDLFPFNCLIYISAALVILMFCLFVFFLINKGSTVIG